MTEEEQRLTYRLIHLTQDELYSIAKAVQDKDLAFARVLYARLETDLHILKDLIREED